MMKTILWERKDSLSLEYFRLLTQPDAFVLEGTVVVMLTGLPTRIRYVVECDIGWKTRSVVVDQERAGDTQRLSLTVDDAQNWYKEQAVLPFATGLLDVDLEITPATNTLPIRRLSLAEGQSREVNAVWIRFPGLTLEPFRQRYTRTGPRRYRYESLTGYMAELEVDEFGLVTRYDDAWHQVRPSPIPPTG